MKRIVCLLMLLAVCLLLASCDPGRNPGESTKPSMTDGVNVEDPVPELLSFDYGRLTLDSRFVKLVGNGIDFTLNFNKKVITPGDDIVLTVYAANYTGDALNFQLETPIVSRQQLIHAALTYGEGGMYSVPVTVAFSEESDLVGGSYDVTVRDRKLLATTVTFHTSAYDNIEESIFNNDYADTYQMVFWFGEDEYIYRVKTDLNHQKQEWDNPDELQSLILPDHYIRVEGDIRFTLTFAQTTHGTDDDIKVHIKADHIGTEPINLVSDFDVSDSTYYIRAELTFGDGVPVRDNVASPSEIAGISSQYLFKREESLERDIEFYTSEFNRIKRSVYHENTRDKCVLRVWLMAEGQTCEIEIPISYGDYLNYSYDNHENPPIVVVEPHITETTTTVTTTETTVPQVTTPVATETIGPPAETTAEPVETTEEPVETTGEPAETTGEPAETTGEPAETTGEPAETTGEPAETTGEPAETTDEPAETTGEPAETTGEPAETTGEPAETTGEPAETTGEPAETTGEPAETTGEPAETTGEPTETTGEPAETTDEPAETTGEPAETTGEPAETTTP